MRRLTIICAALACLVLASPAAAFTLTVTPAEATGNQPIHLTISNLPKSVRPSGVEVKVRDAYKGCESEPSGWVWNGYAPNERGFFELCGYLWEGTGTFYTECGGGSCREVEEKRLVEEAETTFNVTASTGELKAQKEAKEAKEAEEAEAKAAKEAQAKQEREATEAKVAAEAKEAQERAARVETETKAHEVQQAEREAIERGVLNPAKASTPASSAADEKLFCEDEPTALLPNGTRCPNTTPAQGNAIVPPTLTKAQRLNKALKQCKKKYKHNHKKLIKCERVARHSR